MKKLTMLTAAALAAGIMLTGCSASDGNVSDKRDSRADKTVTSASTERDREDLAKFAAKEILKDLLATADNLALALEKAKDKDEPFVKGVQLVYDGFLKVLADHGATPFDSVGEPFDTAFHEALTQQPSDTVPEGHVMTEFKRGWLLNGKLLRAAQVVVSSGKPE